MKTFFLLALFAAAALAAPPSYNGDEKNAETIRYNNDQDVFNYKVDLETTNGIKKDEQGELANPGSDNEVYRVRGSYSYPGPDGQIYTVTYVADENGFQPSAPHIPK